MKQKHKIIIHFFGLLLLFNGGFMLLTSLLSFIYKDGVTHQLFVSGLSVLSVGLLVMLCTKKHSKEMTKRQGYIVVTFGWIVMALSGTIPYILTGSITNFTNAFFETISGYTTTGATILNDIEVLPEGILFWRSLTHWIGGMGIIVLAIAILPLLGIGGMQLFAAEAPGPGTDKLHPRITDTAKRLWLIYVGYTAAETLFLSLAGMSFFDALNHSMSTLSTGGFSTKNASLAYWNDTPMIQYIVVFFMFLAGTNFVLSYFGFKGNFSKISRDEEFKLYAKFILIFTTITAVIIYMHSVFSDASFPNHPMVFGELEASIRHALFQVVAIVTTTGFVSADFTLWPYFLVVFFFGLMFLGGSSGSTSGGVKVVRHLVLIRNGFLEFKRSLHPNAVLPVRYNTKTVSGEIVFNVLGFFMLYMLSFIIGALGFAFIGLDFESAIGVAASSLGNVGPALGDFGPAENFSKMPQIGKWWGAFLMLIGRLELFTVLILLTPFFWKKL